MSARAQPQAGHRIRWPACGVPALLLLALAAALVAPVRAAVADVPPGVGVQLLDMPATGRGDARAERYIVDHVSPGATLTRRLRVTNGLDTPARLELYAAAAEIVDGAFVVGSGRARNELTGWMTVSPGVLELAPWSSGEAVVTIAVPADASGGERYAVALAERPADPAAPGGLAVTSRVGVRVYLSVTGGAEPPTDFAVPSLRAGRDADGNPLVTATVHNTGARAIDVSGRLALTGGPGSLRAGPFDVDTVTALAPGDQREISFALDARLPDGPWTAHVELRSGRVRRVATAEITFPPPGTMGLHVPARVPSGAPLPLVLAAALLVLAAGFLTLRLRSRE